MAGSSFFALLDDIATLLDDIAAMSKMAAQKSAGIVTDDMAAGANQVMGVAAERELPVIWAVAKGSAVNKAILIPAALALSTFLPGLIMPLMVIAGSYLCYEGFEKVSESFHKPESLPEGAAHEVTKAAFKGAESLMAYEQKKIKGAIRTDFILSAEIILLTLGIVAASSFVIQFVTMIGVGALMTVGVYGIVAGIVRLDDWGMALLQDKDDDAISETKRRLGRGLVNMAPRLMRGISILGTLAMFTVGGGIIIHNVPGAHDFIHDGLHHLGSIGAHMPSIFLEVVVGFFVGGMVMIGEHAARPVYGPVVACAKKAAVLIAGKKFKLK